MIRILSTTTIPLIITLTAFCGLVKKVDIFTSLTDGAKEGLKITVSILPSIISLLSAIYMLRASGFIDALTAFVTPLFHVLGIPAEITPLILLRPFSGSGSLAIGSELISKYGADSLIGRSVAVMLGSTETTFYVISVYFGSLGIKKLRHTVPSALAADITSFIVATLITKLLWG